MASGSDIRTVTVNLTGGVAPMALTIEADLTQPSHRSILESLGQGRLYEPSLSKFLVRVLRAGDGFLDVGAHIGYFTLLASFLVGEAGRGVAIEANPDNHAWLNRLVAMNARANVTAVNAVAFDSEGMVDFYTNADNDGGHALWDPGRHDFNTKSRAAPRKETHEAIRIDRLAERLGLNGLRAAKVDTEGAEVSVLRGAGEFLTPALVPFVVCEVNEFGLAQMGASQKDLRAMMAARGYSCFTFQPDDRLPSLVPAGAEFVSPYVFNVLFTTPDALGEVWPRVTPFID